MKARILFNLLLVAIICPVIAHTQSACTKTIFTSSTDLTQRQFPKSDIAVIKDISYAKPDLINGAPDVSFKDECSATDLCSKNSEALRYDMYYPTSHDYNSCPLPVMIMFHPGGFSDCSNKNNNYMQTYCIEFARRGFVAINLEYRRGVNEDESQPDRKYSTANQMLAIYRAVQDLRGAVRSVIARQLDNSFPNIRIDSSSIFIGGAGTTVMSAAFYTQQMFNDLLPGVKESLGKLDEKYYYGGIAIPFKVRGVMNIWGGIFTTVDRSFADYFIENQENIAPLISFHGALDDLIPVEQGFVYILDSPYNSETLCLDAPFRIKNKNGNQPDFIYVGSKSIYEFFDNILKVPSEVYIDCNMDHRLTYSTGFGTGITDPDSIQNYMVSRTVTFFQAVVAGKAKTLKDSRFIDCANYRKADNWADDNNNCKESDSCPSFGGGKKSDPFWEIPKSTSSLEYVARLINGSYQIQLKKAGNATVEVFDGNGQLLQRLNSGNGQFSINLKSIHQDLVIIKISQNGLSKSEKIMMLPQ